MRNLALIVLALCPSLFFSGCANDPSTAQKPNPQNSEQNIIIDPLPQPEDLAQTELALKQEKSKDVTSNVINLYKSLTENSKFVVDTSSWFSWLE